MALKNYYWRGFTWQIAEEDLDKYPGAVPVDAPKVKKASTAPANKTRRSPKNNENSMGL